MNLLTALRIQPGALVSFSGAGGKTTALFRLAAELAAAGYRVVSTTTTHLHRAQRSLAPCALEVRDLSTLQAQLPAALAQHRHVLLTAGPAPEPDRLAGLPAEWVDELGRMGGVDVVLVEADGARGLSLKAPAAHEPVVPSRTTLLVPLAAADVLGRPLDGQAVHRPELVAGLTGLRPGEPLTAPAVARLLAHPQGGAKGLPAGARLVPLINKVDIRGSQEGELDMLAAQLLTHPQVDEVVFAAARAPDPVQRVKGRVLGVILAAGEARRFGSIKQLAPWQGTTLLQHVVSQVLAAERLQHVQVVLGAQADTVRPALDAIRERVSIVLNPDWAAGQASSLQAALAARETANLAAALFILADQPSITPQTIDALVATHETTRAPIVAPRYRGQRGNPVLFDRSTFTALQRLQGDTGGRAILADYADRIAWVDIDRPAPPDIDTPADLARLMNDEPQDA